MTAGRYADGQPCQVETGSLLGRGDLPDRTPRSSAVHEPLRWMRTRHRALPRLGKTVRAAAVSVAVHTPNTGT
jgi:hypothetical protein